MTHNLSRTNPLYNIYNLTFVDPVGTINLSFSSFSLPGWSFLFSIYTYIYNISIPCIWVAFPVFSQKSRNCLTQVVLGNLGPPDLNKAIVSLTPVLWSWVPQGSPLMKGGSLMLSAIRRTVDVKHTNTSLFPSSAPKDKILHWEP